MGNGKEIIDTDILVKRRSSSEKCNDISFPFLFAFSCLVAGPCPDGGASTQTCWEVFWSTYTTKFSSWSKIENVLVKY